MSGLKLCPHGSEYLRVRLESENNDGFTLIELLIVMVIIGILTAIAVPLFLNQRVDARDAEAKSDLRGLATQEELHLSNNGSYDTIAALRAAQDEVQVSKGDTVSVVFYSGSTSYCLSAKHASSPNIWFYDSRNYGMQPRGASGCAVTTSGTAGDSLTG
jgi:type IV pilus assembly protein PilA